MCEGTVAHEYVLYESRYVLTMWDLCKFMQIIQDWAKNVSYKNSVRRVPDVIGAYARVDVDISRVEHTRACSFRLRLRFVSLVSQNQSQSASCGADLQKPSTATTQFNLAGLIGSGGATGTGAAGSSGASGCAWQCGNAC
jgi:hypothetical protein